MARIPGRTGRGGAPNRVPRHRFGHGHGFRAVQHHGRHGRTVFGKGMGAMPDIPFGCGRNLQPVRHNAFFLGCFGH
jgi:hypothetical protein